MEDLGCFQELKVLMHISRPFFKNLLELDKEVMHISRLMEVLLVAVWLGKKLEKRFGFLQ